MRISPVNYNRYNNSSISFGKFKNIRTERAVLNALLPSPNDNDMVRWKSNAAYRILKDCDFIEISLDSDNNLNACVDMNYIEEKIPEDLKYIKSSYQLDTPDKIIRLSDNAKIIKEEIYYKEHPKEARKKFEEEQRERMNDLDDSPSAEEISRARAEYLAYW